MSDGAFAFGLTLQPSKVSFGLEMHEEINAMDAEIIRETTILRFLHDAKIFSIHHDDFGSNVLQIGRRTKRSTVLDPEQITPIDVIRERRRDK